MFSLELKGGKRAAFDFLRKLKLAYNAIGWTDDVTHALKGPRRTSATSDQLAGFLERWSFGGLPTPYPTWLQPLIVRNQVLRNAPDYLSNLVLPL